MVTRHDRVSPPPNWQPRPHDGTGQRIVRHRPGWQLADANARGEYTHEQRRSKAVTALQTAGVRHLRGLDKVSAEHALAVLSGKASL